jgi:sensor histidine kinase YesM
MKVHRLKLSSYQRYIYINPIEGVFVSYHGVNKFPISPNYVLKLSEIQETKFISENAWYQKKNNYYFSVKTANQKSIFFINNLDLMQFWVNEVHISTRFYKWLNSILDKRYNPRACSVDGCEDDENNPKYYEKADELINFILNITLPEVDMD